MAEKKKFRRILFWLFWGGAAFTACFTWYRIDHSIPDKLSIVAQEKEEFAFDFPFQMTLMSESEEVVLGNRSNIPAQEIRMSSSQPFSLYAQNEGSYQLDMKLFGTIPFKEIQVDVVEERYAVPCGTPIGLYLQSEGILVVGTGRVRGEDGQEKEPAYGVLQSGDYIETVNGKAMKNKEELIETLNQNGGNEVQLRIRRGGVPMEIRMEPVKDADGAYKLGIWVRDDTQGIGTITYVDQNGNFGALGHGISDSDTGEVVEIREGALYDTEIMGIDKGSAGKPGVMAGVIYYGPGSRQGTISRNTNVGIFGTASESLRKTLAGEPMEIGYRQDVKKGQAFVRSAVSGQMQDYEIEIQKVDYNPIQENKGLVIKVVDPELIRLTGGIVQGMSGSPIIQDGKLVGAVTHVFVQDPTRGYGVFLETMLEH